MTRRTSPSLARRLRPSLVALLLLASCGEPESPPEPPLPEGALEVVAVEPGVPREKLARAVDALFTAEGIGETRALVVMHEGEVVAERYAGDYDADTRFIGWSMSKTVTGILTGLMVSDGRVRLDDPAPVSRWQRPGEPRGDITVRHLMQMRSGLRHEEKAEPVYNSPEVRMLFLDGRDDMAGWAEAQPLDHEPGTTFRYSTPTSMILSDIVTRLLVPDGDPDERQRIAAQFLAARLTEPAGLDSMVAEYDSSGTMVGGSAIWANARDWAKFGELLRHGGSVKGVQVVPRGWVGFMRNPSPASPDYGGQLWLNRDSDNDRDILFAEQGPQDLFAAVGHLGQYILVSPSQKLTVVRLGKTDEAERGALVDALAAIVALYPER